MKFKFYFKSFNYLNRTGTFKETYVHSNSASYN